MYLPHIFQDSCFSGSRFIRVQVWILEVALCIYMEITLQHRSSPVNLLEHLWRTASVCLNFGFFAFVLVHSFYVSCELSYSSVNWSIEEATGRSSTKKLYSIFTQKLLEEVQVLVQAYKSTKLNFSACLFK